MRHPPAQSGRRDLELNDRERITVTAADHPPRPISGGAIVLASDQAEVRRWPTTLTAERPGEAEFIFSEVRRWPHRHYVSPPFEWNVTVQEPASKFRLEPGTTTLEPEQRTPVAATIVEPNGTTTAVTENASIEIADQDVLRHEDGDLVAIAPGETTVTAEHEWRTANVTMVVAPPEDDLAGTGLVATGAVVLLVALGVRRLADRGELSVQKSF